MGFPRRNIWDIFRERPPEQHEKRAASRKKRQEHVVRLCASRWSNRALSASMNSLCQHYEARKMCKRALTRLGARCGLEVAAAMRSWLDVWGQSRRHDAILEKCGRRCCRLLLSRSFTSWLDEYRHTCSMHEVGERCFSQWANREVSCGWLGVWGTLFSPLVGWSPKRTSKSTRKS